MEEIEQLIMEIQNQYEGKMEELKLYHSYLRASSIMINKPNFPEWDNNLSMISPVSSRRVSLDRLYSDLKQDYDKISSIIEDKMGHKLTELMSFTQWNRERKLNKLIK